MATAFNIVIRTAYNKDEQQEIANLMQMLLKLSVSLKDDYVQLAFISGEDKMHWLVGKG